MLPADCARRLAAELRGALDACAERQRRLEGSLSVSRRLLRAWEPAGVAAPEPPPGPETNQEDLSSACTPSPRDLKELELVTQALEKALRVRKGISKLRGRDRTPRVKSGPVAASSGTTAPAPPQASSRAGRSASRTRLTQGIHQTTVPAKDQPNRRLLSVGDGAQMRTGAPAVTRGPGLGGQQIAPPAVAEDTETFTLKEKGTLLQLPVAFRKAASQNSRLWAQLNSAQMGDSSGTTSATKKHFLQKMQMSSGSPGPRLSTLEVQAEVRRLRKACALLRQRVREELSAVPADWMQEYRSLLTLEGLQTTVGQCLQRLQALRAGDHAPPVIVASTERPPGACVVGQPPQAPAPCGDAADPSWSPQLLFYSSTQELQTLAALRLRVAMLDQQIHLEKVLMAELLPLLRTQEPQGPSWVALCRGAHSLLCEGGEHFLTVLRDDPAD